MMKNSSLRKEHTNIALGANRSRAFKKNNNNTTTAAGQRRQLRERQRGEKRWKKKTEQLENVISCLPRQPAARAFDSACAAAAPCSFAYSQPSEPHCCAVPCWRLQSATQGPWRDRSQRQPEGMEAALPLQQKPTHRSVTELQKTKRKSAPRVAQWE